MEIIFKMHSLVQNSTNFDGKHMAVLFYIERKHFFSYWNQEISVQCGFYLVGPQKLTLSPYSRNGTEGQYQLIMSS